MPLTETRLRNLKAKSKSYKLADQRGLYIEVTPTGGKLWRFRYRVGKIEKKLAIGPYPEVSLKEAREAAYEGRHLVASGGDPALEKRKRKIREEFLSAQTFEAVAREYIEQMMVKNGRAETTVLKANYFLDQLAPAIGDRRISEIEPFEVLAPLKKLEATGKHETAKKCRSFASRVFRYAVATTRCQTDPTSLLNGALVTPRATHYAAILEPQEFGALLRAIDGYSGYPRSIQACGVMSRAQSAKEGIEPRSSRTCCSPMRRTGTVRPSALTSVAPNRASSMKMPSAWCRKARCRGSTLRAKRGHPGDDYHDPD